uniref:LRAT domain-containing protein n=1 Tax=Catharus ustulatus TaxID=91951 RepID=A0A8C3VAB8_CATUS
MSDFEYTPNLGDMIEIKREQDDHWALYVGDGYVIHGTPVAGSETIVIKKITKELLKEVVGNDSWAVNNKYDQYCCPLPVEVIIRRAERCIDGELPYYVIDFKADGFVTKLRYGGQLMTFVGIELCIPDTIYDQNYPNPGDMIEIKQPGHHHWALYMGDGYVIHVTAVGRVDVLCQNAEGMLRCSRSPMYLQVLLHMDPVCVDEVSGNSPKAI